jgi:hypothetical protein
MPLCVCGQNKLIQTCVCNIQYVCVYIYTYIYIYIYIYIYPRSKHTIRACKAFIHAYHACIHTYSTQTLSHAHRPSDQIHVYIHTYIHTYIQTLSLASMRHIDKRKVSISSVEDAETPTTVVAMPSILGATAIDATPSSLDDVDAFMMQEELDASTSNTASPSAPKRDAFPAANLATAKQTTTIGQKSAAFADEVTPFTFESISGVDNEDTGAFVSMKNRATDMTRVPSNGSRPSTCGSKTTENNKSPAPKLHARRNSISVKTALFGGMKSAMFSMAPKKYGASPSKELEQGRKLGQKNPRARACRSFGSQRVDLIRSWKTVKSFGINYSEVGLCVCVSVCLCVCVCVFVCSLCIFGSQGIDLIRVWKTV